MEAASDKPVDAARPNFHRGGAQERHHGGQRRASPYDALEMAAALRSAFNQDAHVLSKHLLALLYAGPILVLHLTLDTPSALLFVVVVVVVCVC